MILNIKYISNKFNRIIFSAIVLNLALFGSINSAMAEEAKNAKVNNSDFGLPTHRRDGGSRSSRDNCVADAENKNLIALIPKKAVAIDTSASAKLFFYVPKVSNQKTLEFVLRNEQDKLVYEAFLSTKGNGIINVELPADLQSNLLESNQNYHWYLSMICNNRQRSRDIVVEGWIYQEEIDIATKKQLETANVLEQAEVYRDRGFWYDALSVLAENDSFAERPLVQQKWFQMLESIGLEKLASQPFIETQLLAPSSSQ